MSDIGNRIFNNVDNALSDGVFSHVLTAYLTGVNGVSASQAVTFLNNHITDNGGDALTSQEIVDLSDIRDKYLAANDVVRAQIRDNLPGLTYLLRQKAITVAFWDQYFID